MQPRCQLLSARLSVPQTVFAAPSACTQRTYATTLPIPAVKNPLQRRKGGDLGSHLPKHVIPRDAYIPAYPYGDHALFKQANRGLYGDQRVQFGNNVSRKTETKTRRYWKPNILSKSLYSVALKKKIKLRITSRVLKTMDREGGLDEYLLKDDKTRLQELGPLGWALRWTLLQRPEVIARMRHEAAGLGLDQATIDEQWPTQEMLAHEKASQRDGKQVDHVRAEDLLPEEFAEDAEEPIEGELVEETEDINSTESDERLRKQAATEYTRAVKAAERYLSRGNVDSEQEGLKLAFIRAKARAQAANDNKESFAKKLDKQFSAKDLKAVRIKHKLPDDLSNDKVKKIAYNQWRREQINLVGSYEAWRANIDAAKQLERQAKIEEAGGLESWSAGQKVMYNRIIEEAETASTNEGMDPEQKEFLEHALIKADRAIEAKESGGEAAYVKMMIENKYFSSAA